MHQRSGDGHRRSSREHHFPNFEMFDAKIASALKKIITNSYFKKGVSLEEQKVADARPISSRKTDCFYDLRILPSDWST